MSSYDQIRIIQAGAELFGFETIVWPSEVFQYPIVYSACAMNRNSYDSDYNWKWIKREQYEWLVKHYSCLVSYVGADLNDGHTFYCNNHLCWEKDGVDFFVLQQEPIAYIEPELEERKI